MSMITSMSMSMSINTSRRTGRKATCAIQGAGTTTATITTVRLVFCRHIVSPSLLACVAAGWEGRKEENEEAEEAALTVFCTRVLYGHGFQATTTTTTTTGARRLLRRRRRSASASVRAITLLSRLPHTNRTHTHTPPLFQAPPSTSNAGPSTPNASPISWRRFPPPRTPPSKTPSRRKKEGWNKGPRRRMMAGWRGS